MSTLTSQLLKPSADESEDLHRQQQQQRLEQLRRPQNRHNCWRYENPDEHCQIPRQAPLPYLLESKLFVLAQQGDLDARNTLWVQHARLAFSAINQFRLPASLLADVLQEGILALRHAIARFDVHRYNAFSTYAWHWIRQGMQRFLHHHRFRMRIPTYLYQPYCRFRHLQHHQLHEPDRPDFIPWYREWNYDEYVRFLDFNRINDALPLHEHLREVPSEFEDDGYEDSQANQELVSTLLNCLKSRSAHVIRRRFGLDGQPAQTLREIGLQMNITRERVRQIEAKALKRLRKQMKLLLKQHKYQLQLELLGPLLATDEDDEPEPNQVTQPPG